jgi:hypothetical protein
MTRNTQIIISADEKRGMDGIDFAFYKNRAFYHTKFDSIPGMGHQESRKALWAIMETVRGAGQALLNDDDVHNEKEPGIYFDSEWLRLIFFILLMRLRQF